MCPERGRARLEISPCSQINGKLPSSRPWASRFKRLTEYGSVREEVMPRNVAISSARSHHQDCC